MSETILQTAKTFFDNIGITVESVTVDKEEWSSYLVTLKTPDSALIIGMHGQNIPPITHLLWRMCEKVGGEFVNIHLEVNDYMKEKDTKFFRYLDSRIDLVMKTGKDIAIPNLSSYERKKAHNYISEKNIAGLRTYSAGEWVERALHIASDGILTPSAPVSKWPSSIDLEEDGVGI